MCTAMIWYLEIKLLNGIISFISVQRITSTTGSSGQSKSFGSNGCDKYINIIDFLIYVFGVITIVSLQGC